MKSKFMKGMNLQEQKKCGILVTVIGLVMFAIGFLLGDAHMGDFYSGLGCGLFVCGAVRLLRVHRLSRDPEKAADYDAMLKTFGCGAAIATSSMATEMIIGKSVQEALEVTNKAVMEALGGLPPVKVHCSLLAEQAVHAALWDYAQKNHITIEGLKPPVNDVDELEEAHKDEA